MRAFHFPFRWLIPAVAACLLAAGCSMARFGYDAFPMWANWQLDSYLALDDPQTDLAKDSIDKLQQWHQKNELPKYADFLREVDARLQKTDETPEALKTAEVRQWRERLMAAWPPVVDQVVPPVTQLLISLKPEQITRMREKVEKSNKEMASKYKLDSPKGMAEARGDRIIERTEFFLGRLSSDQKRSIREQAAQLPADETMLLAERQVRQQALVTLIGRLQADRPPKPLAEKLVRDYLLTTFTPSDPQRKVMIEKTQVASDEMTARVLNNATDEQKKTMSKLLRTFADDFERRSKEG